MIGSPLTMPRCAPHGEPASWRVVRFASGRRRPFCRPRALGTKPSKAQEFRCW